MARDHERTMRNKIIGFDSAVSGLTYEAASARAETMQVDGLDLKVISLDDLIVNKRASGRPKDLADAMTLEKLKGKKNG